jgi:uncharacterized protein
MTSESYHERHEDLSEATRDLHRAITSLMEELEAVDWYQQRVDATPDPALRAILAHNRDEEIEHAAMVLEWLRRNNATFDQQLRRYLFTTDPIVGMEAAERGEAGSGDSAAADPPFAKAPSAGHRSLGVGGLKSR